MVRGKRRTVPFLEDAMPVKVKEDLASVFYDTDKISLASATTDTVYSLKDEVKELEKRVAELSLRVPKPGRRVKSIRIKF